MNRVEPVAGVIYVDVNRQRTLRVETVDLANALGRNVQGKVVVLAGGGPPEPYATDLSTFYAIWRAS